MVELHLVQADIQVAVQPLLEEVPGQHGVAGVAHLLRGRVAVTGLQVEGLLHGAVGVANEEPLVDGDHLRAVTHLKHKESDDDHLRHRENNDDHLRHRENNDDHLRHREHDGDDDHLQ